MNKYDASLVNTWISSALNRGVKSLHVGSHFGLSFSNLTSHFLFNSINLEELVLEVYNCSLVVPTTHFYLGHLKILKLCGIKFTLDDSSYSESLRLSFPVLKEFETVNCSWLIAKGIILDVPLLERIFIKYEQEYPSYEQEKLQFSASRLKEFTYHGYHGYIAKDIVLRDPSSAYNASANIILSNCKEPVAEIGNHAVLLLKQLCQVLAQSRVSTLPPFAMLSYLELGFVSCKVLLVLLQKSPLLKRLVFKGLNKFDKALINSAIVPHCFKTSLQMLKFGNVLGREYELCLAKFCMKNCSRKLKLCDIQDFKGFLLSSTVGHLSGVIMIIRLFVFQIN
ncbi:hypothetical protein RIF29_38884 [Crotalaria pallida]|uniref:FBD domain-containing protein n=1 Tax=Crotalaria pallida TaxID=3830 RepID=A0AAN9HPB9_CROPI